MWFERGPCSFKRWGQGVRGGGEGLGVVLVHGVVG